MKKSKRKVILIVGSLVLVVLAIMLINILPLLSMKPTVTGFIEDTKIYAINNNINSVYFIDINGEYLLVDAGSSLKTIENAMKEANISPSDVKHVLLTHSDGDHVGALSLFSNAKIYMSEDEIQMINGETKRSWNKSNSLPNDIKQDSINFLKENQELIIGNHTIKCIKAPGHTPGSMAYILDGDYLFSGDSFKVDKNILSIHPFTMDNEKAKESIRELFDSVKETKLTLTAHYGYYSSADLKLDK